MCCLLVSRQHKQPHKSALGALGDAQCVRRQWGVCARVCEMWDVAGWLLLLMGGVLCVERCGGVRRACAVRVCVVERACVCGAVRAPVCAAGCTVLCACLLCCAVLMLLMGSVFCVWRWPLRWRATCVCCARVRVGYVRASALLVARRCGLCDVLCSAPVYCAVWRRLGWQGCAVGCGALRVVVRP